MAITLPTRNKLAYPVGRAPGFDPAHVALSGGAFARLSCIAAGTAINLLNGKAGSITGSQTAGIDGVIGPFVNYATGFNSFATAAAADATVTMACICIPGTTGIDVYVISSTNDTGWGLFVDASNILGGFSAGNVLVMSGITLTNGVPYFIAMSGNASALRFVARNLATGAIRQATSGTVPGAPSASNGTSCVGGDNFANAALGKISHAVHTTANLSPAQLLQWAQDPWSFWYPRLRATNSVPAIPPPVLGGRSAKARPINPLHFPVGRKPGVDLTHVALARGKALFSGVSVSTGFLNLLNGKPGTVGGSSVTPRQMPFGPSQQFNFTNDRFTFTGNDATAYASSTIAAIVQFDTVASNFNFIFSSDGSGSGGVQLNLDASAHLQFTMWGNVAETMPTFVFAANVPYLMIASQNGTTDVKYFVKRLDTGVTYTASSASSTTIAGDGTYIVGNDAPATACAQGKIAAVAYTSGAMSFAEMQTWSEDPWSFWYPKTRYNQFAVAPQGGGRTRRLWNRNALAFPVGVRPGFDPKHLAAKGAVASAIPSGTNWISLLSGKPASIPGAVSTSAIQDIGPTTLKTASNSGHRFSGVMPAIVPPAYTLAVICRYNSLGTNSWLASVGDSGAFTTGMLIGCDVSGNLTVSMPGGSNPTSLGGFTEFVVGAPCFVAVSVSGTGKASAVVKRLDGSRTFSYSGTGGAIGAANSDGTMQVSGWDGGFAADANLAAAMASTQFLTTAELLQWSDDPWSFWYPKQRDTELAYGIPPAAPVSSGGNIFTRTIAAASAAAVAVVKTVGKIVSSASSGATSFVKSIGRNISIGSTGATSFIKSVGKTIAASSTTSSTAIKVIIVSVAVACNSAVSWLKSVGKNAPVASSGAVSFIKSVGKIVPVASSGAVSVIKSVAKTILAACAGAASSTAIKVKIVTVPAFSNGAVSLSRTVGKLLPVISTGSVSFAKLVAHTVTVASSTATSFAKTVGKVVSAVAAGAVSVAYSFGTSGHTVWPVTINVAARTVTQWLAGFFKKAGPESLPRASGAEANTRSSDWPSTPRN